MRSSTPGPKFSTSTSQVWIRRVSTSLPFGCLVSSVIERLLWFSMVKYRLSTSGISRNCPRVMSPIPGRSTLITSAPNHARSCVQVGPDCTCVKSRMRTPSSALLIVCLLVLFVRRGFDFYQTGAQFALLGEAGGFVAHDGDDARNRLIGGEQH